MTISSQLQRLGIDLPPVPQPIGAYRPAVRDGDLVFTSGQLPIVDGVLTQVGLVGGAISPEVASAAARICALNALAAAADVAGGVDELARVVKVTGFVASADGFTGQPGVVNGASEFFGEVFGEAGVHARSAVGAACLPLGAPVEVEVVFRVR